MRIHDARELGERLTRLVSDRQVEAAYGLLSPLLTGRISFRLLDAIGAQVGNEPSQAANLFLDRVADQRTMGGWVVIASALRQQFSHDLPGTFDRCRTFVTAADVWYATDTFGERVPGPALVAYFEPALALLEPWQEDPNRWVRRMVGVAVHFWTKRSHGAVQFLPQANALLNLLSPLFEERDTDVIKGVGWGLKTLGKYYPELASDWLVQQAGRPHRALMLRKATTYLPASLQQHVKENF